jgi:hypothetical protein
MQVRIKVVRREVFMRATGWSMVAFLVAALGSAPLAAQDVTELLAAGRYEDAAALLADVGPETAHVGAEMIFERAYETDFQSEDWENAIRGFTAGATVPHLSERQAQRFAFWHGVALRNIVLRDRGTDLDKAEALAVLDQAYELLLMARDYAAGINQMSMSVNVARLIDEISTGN